jgi:hypothetical protein
LHFATVSSHLTLRRAPVASAFHPKRTSVVASREPVPCPQRASFNCLVGTTQPLGRWLVVRKVFDCTARSIARVPRSLFPIPIACHGSCPRLENYEGPPSTNENGGPSNSKRHALSWGANSVHTHARQYQGVPFVLIRQEFANSRHKRRHARFPSPPDISSLFCFRPIPELWPSP